MNLDNLTCNDNREIRCPMLGHTVTFAYCRSPGNEIPCRKIFDCWWEIFDIKEFIEANYPAETRQKITEPPKQKTLSLLELIEQARKRKNISDSASCHTVNEPVES